MVFKKKKCIHKTRLTTITCRLVACWVGRESLRCKNCCSCNNRAVTVRWCNSTDKYEPSSPWLSDLRPTLRWNSAAKSCLFFLMELIPKHFNNCLSIYFFLHSLTCRGQCALAVTAWKYGGYDIIAVVVWVLTRAFRLFLAPCRNCWKCRPQNCAATSSFSLRH